MFRAVGFLLGALVGAQFVGHAATHALLYLFTGRLLVPSMAGVQLISVEEAELRLRELSEKAMEMCHE